MNPHTNLFEQRRILAFLREPQTGDMGWTDEEAEKRERAYERLVDLLESLDAHMSSGGTAPDAWITSLAYVGGRGRTPPPKPSVRPRSRTVSGASSASEPPRAEDTPHPRPSTSSSPQARPKPRREHAPT